jgi:hypothetical protein
MRIARLTPLRTAQAALVLLGLVFGLLLAPPAEATGTAPAGPASASTAAAKKSTVLKCANKAKKQAKKNKKYKYWVCLGTKVKYLKKKKAPPSPLVKQEGQWTSWATSRGSKVGPRPQGIPEDDARCELVPECTRIITLYTADIKANALYGYNDEIWGAFDVIYFQTFNGASSRYRLTLIYDWGYDIDSQWWTAHVRRNITGWPDDTTGEAYFYPGIITVYGQAQVYPSTSTFVNTEPTTHRGKHHDDLYGNFIANGLVWGTSTLHLPDFHCPNNLCKYYGPTGSF